MKHLEIATRREVVFLFVFLTIVSLGFTPGEGKVYLDIHSPDLVPFPIAVADFVPSDQKDREIIQKIQQVISNDLMISGLFRVIESKDFPPQVKLGNTSEDFEVWAGVGVDALLTGNFQVSANTLTGTPQLYDLIGKKLMYSHRYEREIKEWRQLAHNIANEVVEQITSEKGIFATRVAFASNRTGNKEIYLIDFDGENLTQITHNGSINILPRWSTDGKRLFYTSFMKRNPDLYAIDLSSQRNFQVSSQAGINASPAWSPHGERMILMLKQNDRSHLFLMKVGARRSVQLTSGSDNYTSPSWSPDGKQIAFVSDRSGSPQIYRMEVDTRKMVRLTFHGQYNVSPAWSPKGDWIAFCSRQDGFFQICLIRPDGEQWRQLTYGSVHNEEPSWSPEGRYLAFTSNRAGSPAIFIMNVNGTHQRRLTTFRGVAMNPSWSPYFE